MMIGEKAEGNKPGSGIDVRSVPRSNIDWQVAFRLRPARLPETSPFEEFGDEDSLLSELAALTSPVSRFQKGLIALNPDLDVGTARPVIAAFANSLPEWRFATRGTAHIVLANSVQAAVAIASEIYGQFLGDTLQSSANLSFKVERYRLSGKLADVSDFELFPQCYNKKRVESGQALVDDLIKEQETGLVFGLASGGLGAVVWQPDALSYTGVERAVCLSWKEGRFERFFDYRDMYWRDL